MVFTSQKHYYQKKRYSRLAGYVFRRVQITTGKITTGKKRYSRLAVRLRLYSDTLIVGKFFLRIQD
jgi:hypothetical protein